MKLHKLATVLAFGLCILSGLASANAARSGPWRSPRSRA